MKNFLLILVFCLTMPLYVGAQARSFSKVEPHSIKSFKKILELKDVSAHILPFGHSFIDKGKLKSKSFFDLRENLKIEKALLLWMGEGVGEDEANFDIELKTSQGKTVTIKPKEKRQSQGFRYVYSCWADVTQFVREKGRYELSTLQSHKVPTPLQAAGWSLLLIVQDKKSRKGNIFITWGLHKLQPGELYNFQILPALKKSFVRSVIVIGGHGQKENGSGNSLNVQTLSMGDDWDGSSGERWDVDQYNVGRTVKGVTITVDPLLQWLFPMSFSVHTEIKE